MMTTNERKRRKIAQDRAEALLLLEIDAKRRKAAGRIFRAMYLYKQMKRIRRLLRSRRAATIIQKRARGIRGRRIAREWKELKAKLSRSALCIQCGYRCHLARRKVRTIAFLYSRSNLYVRDLGLISARKAAHMHACSLIVHGFVYFLSRRR
jgi:hypothetical protein